MNPSLFKPEMLLIPGICLAGLVLWTIAVLLRRALRLRSLRNLAGELGFSYSRRVTDQAPDDAESSIRQGLETGLAFDNAMSGELGGFHIEIYDQVLSQILAGSSMASHTIIEISRSGHQTPEFILQPDSRLARRFRLLEGETSVNPDGDLAFSGRNYLRGMAATDIQDLFGKEARALLEDNKKLWIQGTGSAYRFYQFGTRLSAGGIRRMLDQAIELARAFIRELPADPATTAMPRDTTGAGNPGDSRSPGH